MRNISGTPPECRSHISSGLSGKTLVESSITYFCVNCLKLCLKTKFKSYLLTKEVYFNFSCSTNFKFFRKNNFSTYSFSTGDSGVKKV